MKQGLFQKKSMVARSAADGEHWGSARAKTVWGEALVCVRVCACARARVVALAGTSRAAGGPRSAEGHAHF